MVENGCENLNRYCLCVCVYVCGWVGGCERLVSSGRLQDLKVTGSDMSQDLKYDCQIQLSKQCVPESEGERKGPSAIHCSERTAWK